MYTSQNTGPAINSAATAHAFNSDLLVTQRDRELASTRFPDIAHILNHQELRDLFNKYDNTACSAKSKSRRVGLLALTLGVVALLGAASEPALHELPHHITRPLGIAFALFGILSVFLGPFGVLYGDAKKHWLYNRLLSERLRQFHFQSLVCGWKDCLDSFADPDQFNKKRATSLATFKAQHLDAMTPLYTSIIDGSGGHSVWLHEKPRSMPGKKDEIALAPIFAAYRELRFNHQIQYANYMLRDDATVFSLAPKPASALFSSISILAIALLLIIHLIISVSLILDSSTQTLLKLLHLSAIWIALLALAFRALEEALQPRQELERYKAYRGRTLALRARFDSAPTSGTKLSVMEEMEELAHEELCDFIKATDEAHFVL